MTVIPVAILLVAMTVAVCFFPTPVAIIVTGSVNLFIIYFFVSPCFGYVELRSDSLFIKYGFLLKKEIPYSKIGDIKKERKAFSDSMMSLKNSFEHIKIKYNSFDFTCVSVSDNDCLIEEIEKRKTNFGCE